MTETYIGAIPLRARMAAHPSVDFEAVDEVIFGCANQAGEDNCNVVRMSARPNSSSPVVSRA